jgi:transglutaminase-like putative cysteine protease
LESTRAHFSRKKVVLLKPLGGATGSCAADSAVIDATSGYCVQKAVALTAAARAAGIPSRLGFADVKNHLQSERLRAAMGTDLFVWHG